MVNVQCTWATIEWELCYLAQPIQELKRGEVGGFKNCDYFAVAEPRDQQPRGALRLSAQSRKLGLYREPAMPLLICASVWTVQPQGNDLPSTLTVTHFHGQFTAHSN